jgi:hypothetical protein
MKSIADTHKLERRARIAQSLSLGGLLLLLGGIVLLFWRPEPLPEATPLAGPLLLIGFIAANTGIYLANRWLKRPRPEDVLDFGLKPLGGACRLYHYLLPADHVLLTPTGIVVFEVVTLGGSFIYRNGRWKQKFSLARTLRFFVEERLGDPIHRARKNAKKIQALIAESIPDALLPVEPMVVFVNPLAELDVDDPPIPVTNGRKLNKRLPLPPKELAAQVYAQVREALEEAAGLAIHNE